MSKANKTTPEVLNQTVQPNADLAAVLVAVMPADVINSIVDVGIKADVALAGASKKHGQAYIGIAASLRAGIDTGLYSDPARAEYLRRRNLVIKGIVNARMVDYAGDDKELVTARHVNALEVGLSRDNKKALWVAPQSAKDRDEAKLAKDAERKAISYEVEKKVEAAVKKNPAADVKALRTAIKTEVTSKTKEEREAVKTVENQVSHKKAVQAGTEKINVATFPDLVQEGRFGDADPRPCLQAFSAFMVLFSDL